MQLKSEYDGFKRLKLILGKENVQKLKNLKILVVGVGGIGCEVLKNLSKRPVKKVVIVDLDIIEISNLNRQFYFRNEHLSQSKAKIAQQQILKLVPNFNIDAIQGNIYDKKFDNFNFYSQFDVVISALDNLKARQHLAKNCTRYGKVLIDAGTSGFNGQSYSSVRFVTSCHNCYPSVQEETFAVCTIRSRPERSIQCAIYAKHIYEQLFGNDTDPLNDELNQIKKRTLNSFTEYSQQKLRKEGVYLFDYIFCHQFQSHEPENRFQINELTFEQAFKSNKPLEPYNSDAKDDSIWSLREYAQVFLHSFVKLAERVHGVIKNGFNSSLTYDKDDRECSLFICCVSNLRVYNFKNDNKKSKKLKYLTFHECRKLIGKIIPAIASTNSIAASLQIKQLTDLFTQHQDLKYFTISPTINEKISFSWLSLPNPQCEICSPYNIYFQVKCSFNLTTFQDFQQFALNHLFSHNRDLYCQRLILIKNVNAKKISPNKKKPLNFKSDLIVENSLTLTYLPALKISDLKVEITLIDEEFAEENKQSKFKILNKQQVQKTIEALRRYRESNDGESFFSNQLQDLIGFENKQYFA